MHIFMYVMFVLNASMYVAIYSYAVTVFYCYSVMKCLVESYPQFAEYGDLKDITPLHWACYHGNYKVAALLLDKVKAQVATLYDGAKIEFVFLCGY